MSSSFPLNSRYSLQAAQALASRESEVKHQASRLPQQAAASAAACSAAAVTKEKSANIKQIEDRTLSVMFALLKYGAEDPCECDQSPFWPLLQKLSKGFSSPAMVEALNSLQKQYPAKQLEEKLVRINAVQRPPEAASAVEVVGAAGTVGALLQPEQVKQAEQADHPFDQFLLQFSQHLPKTTQGKIAYVVNFLSLIAQLPDASQQKIYSQCLAHALQGIEPFRPLSECLKHSLVEIPMLLPMIHGAVFHEWVCQQGKGQIAAYAFGSTPENSPSMYFRLGLGSYFDVSAYSSPSTLLSGFVRAWAALEKQSQEGDKRKAEILQNILKSFGLISLTVNPNGRKWAMSILLESFEKEPLQSIMASQFKGLNGSDFLLTLEQLNWVEPLVRLQRRLKWELNHSFQPSEQEKNWRMVLNQFLSLLLVPQENSLKSLQDFRVIIQKNRVETSKKIKADPKLQELLKESLEYILKRVLKHPTKELYEESRCLISFALELKIFTEGSNKSNQRLLLDALRGVANGNQLPGFLVELEEKFKKFKSEAGIEKEIMIGLRAIVTSEAVLSEDQLLKVKKLVFGILEGIFDSSKNSPEGFYQSVIKPFLDKKPRLSADEIPCLQRLAVELLMRDNSQKEGLALLRQLKNCEVDLKAGLNWMLNFLMKKLERALVEDQQDKRTTINQVLRALHVLGMTKMKPLLAPFIGPLDAGSSLLKEGELLKVLQMIIIVDRSFAEFFLSQHKEFCTPFLFVFLAEQFYADKLIDNTLTWLSKCSEQSKLLEPTLLDKVLEMTFSILKDHLLKEEVVNPQKIESSLTLIKRVMDQNSLTIKRKEPKEKQDLREQLSETISRVTARKHLGMALSFFNEVHRDFLGKEEILKSMELLLNQGVKDKNSELLQMIIGPFLDLLNSFHLIENESLMSAMNKAFQCLFKCYLKKPSLESYAFLVKQFTRLFVELPEGKLPDSLTQQMLFILNHYPYDLTQSNFHPLENDLHQLISLCMDKQHFVQLSVQDQFIFMARVIRMSRPSLEKIVRRSCGDMESPPLSLVPLQLFNRQKREDVLQKIRVLCSKEDTQLTQSSASVQVDFLKNVYLALLEIVNEGMSKDLLSKCISLGESISIKCASLFNEQELAITNCWRIAILAKSKETVPQAIAIFSKQNVAYMEEAFKLLVNAHRDLHLEREQVFQIFSEKRHLISSDVYLNAVSMVCLSMNDEDNEHIANVIINCLFETRIVNGFVVVSCSFDAFRVHEILMELISKNASSRYHSYAFYCYQLAMSLPRPLFLQVEQHFLREARSLFNFIMRDNWKEFQKNISQQGRGGSQKLLTEYQQALVMGESEKKEMVDTCTRDLLPLLLKFMDAEAEVDMKVNYALFIRQILTAVYDLKRACQFLETLPKQNRFVADQYFGHYFRSKDPRNSLSEEEQRLISTSFGQLIAQALEEKSFAALESYSGWIKNFFTSPIKKSLQGIMLDHMHRVLLQVQQSPQLYLDLGTAQFYLHLLTDKRGGERSQENQATALQIAEIFFKGLDNLNRLPHCMRSLQHPLSDFFVGELQQKFQKLFEERVKEFLEVFSNNIEDIDAGLQSICVAVLYLLQFYKQLDQSNGKYVVDYLISKLLNAKCFSDAVQLANEIDRMELFHPKIDSKAIRQELLKQGALQIPSGELNGKGSKEDLQKEPIWKKLISIEYPLLIELSQQSKNGLENYQKKKQKLAAPAEGESQEDKQRKGINVVDVEGEMMWRECMERFSVSYGLIRQLSSYQHLREFQATLTPIERLFKNFMTTYKAIEAEVGINPLKEAKKLSFRRKGGESRKVKGVVREVEPFKYVSFDGFLHFFAEYQFMDSSDVLPALVEKNSGGESDSDSDGDKEEKVSGKEAK